MDGELTGREGEIDMSEERSLYFEADTRKHQQLVAERMKECSPKMALSSIGEKALAALALFEDD